MDICGQIVHSVEDLVSEQVRRAHSHALHQFPENIHLHATR